MLRSWARFLVLNWTIVQFGLIGMPIFVGFLSYLIVQFKTFNVKLIAAQVLVFALGFMVLSVEFLQNITSVHYVIIFTLIFVLILGAVLIKSVKREIQQREHLEQLTTELEASLRQRESLTHLITHKIKGVLTRSKAVFSEMADGTFGELTPELKKIAQQGLESDIEGVQTIDLVLNAANLAKGTIKFDMKTVDLKAIVMKISDEKKAAAEAKHLSLETNISYGSYLVYGDAFWLTEVVRNLVDNAIKYTLEGKVTIRLEQNGSKNLFSVTDTGVGISPEDMKNMFKEGGRGKDSVKINLNYKIIR